MTDSALTPLDLQIRAQIAASGPMRLDEVMAIALGDPDHGYYQKAEPFGQDGDFITAPEISQCFGELIGLWAVQLWRDAGAPAPFNLVELGPGRGTLMADALRSARLDPTFIQAAQIHLVETSERLREQQATKLANLASPTWHDTIDGVSDDFSIFIANEFFDALPIRQFQRLTSGWAERMVTDNGTSLTIGAEAIDKSAAPLDRTQQTAPMDSVVEVSEASIEVAQQIAKRIVSQGGGALIIDYGYSDQDRPTGQPWAQTLQALHGQKPAPALTRLGEADITAHVDFGRLARAAVEVGAAASPVIPQGTFLEALGIGVRLQQLLANAKDGEQVERLRSGVARLTDQTQMGSLFKVLALHHPQQPPLAGFPVTTP
ncbi:MAG: SAM-dependent methyltransferase [Alphaproteobacteria bacterium]|nr:SAM-dependent methyltransferase [Alphaproteobacteria bacterium SS10]